MNYGKNEELQPRYEGKSHQENVKERKMGKYH